MLIKVVGKRSFQVSREEIKSACREMKGKATLKICYLDPGFDYEVSDTFGADMIKRYPMDFVGQNVVNTYVPPEEKLAAKVEAKAKSRQKKG